jgi:hypothetical protein
MASYDPTGTAMPTLSPGPTCPGITQGIVQATPTTFEFKQDLNGNGVTTDSGEDVIYTLTGTQITRQDGAAAAVPLVDGVPTGGLTFQYYDCNNAELVPGGSPAQLSTDYRACICKVRVTLTAQLADPQFVNIQPLISAVQTEVAVRNRSITNTSF